MKLLALALATLTATSAFAAKTATEATFKADTSATQIMWTGKKKIGSQHTGAVKLKEGAIVLSKDTIKSGKIAIDLNTITNEDLKDSTYNAKLVNHLKSDDFFSVEKFPVAEFTIKKVTALKGDKAGNTHLISGDFTLKGVTNELSFPAKVMISDNVLNAEAKISVDRTKWGLKYGSANFFKNLGDKVIENNFMIDLKLQAKK